MDDYKRRKMPNIDGRDADVDGRDAGVSCSFAAEHGLSLWNSSSYLLRGKSQFLGVPLLLEETFAVDGC